MDEKGKMGDEKRKIEDEELRGQESVYIGA